MWDWLDYITFPLLAFLVGILLLTISYELSKSVNAMMLRVLRPLERLASIRKQLEQRTPLAVGVFRAAAYSSWSTILLLVILPSIPSNILDPWKDTIPSALRLVVLFLWLACMMVGMGIGVAEALPSRKTVLVAQQNPVAADAN